MIPGLELAHRSLGAAPLRRRQYDPSRTVLGGELAAP